jgi:thiol-disulfide isomerase/thioredoxin
MFNSAPTAPNFPSLQEIDLMNRSSNNVHVALACIAVFWGGALVLRSLPIAHAQNAPAADATSITAKDLKLETLDIPAGDADALDRFITELGEGEPVGETEDEHIAHAQKVLATILDAANKMLAGEATDDQKVMAERYRLMALQGLSDLGHEQAREVFAAALDATMNNPRPEIASIGWQSYLVAKISNWADADEAAKDELLAKIVERVKSPNLSSLEVGIVNLVANNLEHNDDPFVIKLLEQTVPAFEASASDEVKSSLEEANLAGMVRRLTLLGKPMEITGDLLGGGEIDWKSYRGKVVLVDFSATWCTPCIEEAPNVLAMYNAYKDKGFDVLAISLDDTEEAAQKYVKDHGIKWATLFPASEAERSWSHPLVRYYGVNGIPTAILVDQQGKAVHMNARDAELRNELKRLLGEPAKAAAGG